MSPNPQFPEDLITFTGEWKTSFFVQCYSKSFTGDCLKNLLKLSMVFDPVNKSGKIVYIFLKTIKI